MFALVDCNSCYASCEQIFRPDLRGKPVVVLTNNDGCIVARTKEAKDLDVPDLIPYFKIKHVLEKHQVHVYSSNYELYGDISKRVMQLLSTQASDMEVYSIDEAFLDLSGHQNLREHGLHIKKLCWKEQRMPVCVGIAPSKTLAKLANHIAKKAAKLEGVCVIRDPNDFSHIFKKIPVKKIWGVGSQISKRLEQYQVFSVEDLRQQSPKHLRKDFGVNIERTIRELNGEACIPLEKTVPAKKEIICSRSFSKKTTEKQDLKESIANYAARACEKLRQQKSLTKEVHIMLLTSRFNPPFYFNSATTRLVYPTNDDRVVIKAALELLEQIFKPGYAYAKAGVMLLDISSDDKVQYDFFSETQALSDFKTMSCIDAVNQKYGKGSLFVGRQGIQREWSMARKLKSPAYTTRLRDVPVIRIS